MLLLKDECSLCKRVLSSSSLRRCLRCGRLYCFDCTIFTEDGNLVCLNCARRMVSPIKYGTKYSALSRYLLRRGHFTERVVLSFAEIEGIVGDNLPLKAGRDPEWWNNTRSSQGRAWIDVGWQTQSVDSTNRTVTFIRVAPPKPKTEKKRKKKTQTQTPFFKQKNLHLNRHKKREPPSKTKIARAVARLKNAERAASTKQFKGKFRSKTAYEKRLFKPENKPSLG